MANEPVFASVGTKAGNIDVLLSYKIVELFSEGLYKSPNKAVEELVANSFDAGAKRVHVLLSPDLRAQGATIAVIDDGEGMDRNGLEQHWLIGISNKRELPKLPLNRNQIGKFGIGKLATYVLANRLTHISKRGTKYYSTSMDYRRIDKRINGGVEPKAPIKISLRRLRPSEAKDAVRPWTESAGFEAAKSPLFGDGSPKSWTISIMSDLKPKAHDILLGRLRWILRTALPLRPDFSVWLDEEKIEPSKMDKPPLQHWIIGKDLISLPRPKLKGITKSIDKNFPEDSDHRFGLDVPGLGRITGYVDAYIDPLKGSKSDEIGRSHGFFVYVYGRLLNADDGHFGISPNELKHGIFSRFRLVVNMDGLDEELRSTREAVGEGTMLETARDILWSIFNKVRQTIEEHDLEEEPGARLARKIASSPNSLSRRPIVEFSRAVAENRAKARYLTVPNLASADERERFLADLHQRAQEPERFVTGVVVDQEGTQYDGIVRFDTASGVLRLNGWHPFVATFYDEFINKTHGQPLELFAMAEVLAEASLHSTGVKTEKIEEFLLTRDQLLRHLANESGRQSAASVANELLNACNSPRLLEEGVCKAFRNLGFDVTPLGQSGNPDGVATANLSANADGKPRRYSVSLEAKSKRDADGKISAKDVGIGGVALHRDKHGCDHAIVVGPAFPTTQGEKSTLWKLIEKDRRQSKADGKARTITLITVSTLAELVQLRHSKQVFLPQIRELFMECKLPEESFQWVGSIYTTQIERHPYRRILDTIDSLQKKFPKVPVTYSSLLNELSHLEPPIVYDTESKIKEICKMMDSMASGAFWAHDDRVELDQNVHNAMATIDAATQETHTMSNRRRQE